MGRTECVVRAALGGLADTVTYLGAYFVAKKLGVVQEKPALFHVMMLMVILPSVLLSTIKLSANDIPTDRGGSA
ncbi:MULTISPECIES: hypothetical protein [unclassified Bradyrhizobium]|uniref:hypothetical protein n=1 Tax=unclassified Bradyrhizobium TaxID=2631580 RepID=UPI0028EBBBFD|nr:MULTISPECIES: hypothetical protein [unclassified Bradyrhizobium]